MSKDNNKNKSEKETTEKALRDLRARSTELKQRHAATSAEMEKLNQKIKRTLDGSGEE
ncbi:hypothetical protein [Sphingobacterium sp. SGR-19]|uniref:hypothetical protein n=1 Tax=Sphingobacterium sp. SGR-19 TaxID=2710886 RepID=UPI0013EAA1DC|nr:hypothetical protein [Sphingobacterium sp. SGR-19]NGM65780.1 hypothetical protein [Sphingobacterium sp. SGR-19]